MIVTIKASSEPITVNLTASKPFPSNNSLWPGRTPNAMSASGAPRNIEGIGSRKLWVTAIEIIKTPRTKGDVKPRKNADKDNKIIEIKFTCMPGIKPVMMPAEIPNNIAANIS